MSQRPLPKGWKQVTVSQVCYVNPSIMIPTDHTDKTVDFVPMDAIDEVTGTITHREKKLLEQVHQGKTRFQVGDVLFAKITPCTQNGKVALVEHIDGDVGYGSTEFYVLRVRKGLLPSYLWYWLRTTPMRKLAVEAMTGSSGRQRVPLFFWGEVSIPLPPLPVQRAIVTILSKADMTRCELAEASDLANKLSNAIFVEMLGHPTKNPHEWPEILLGELLERIQRPIHTKAGDNYHQVTVRWYGKGAIVRKHGLGSERRTTRQYLVNKGDFIYSRIDARKGAFAIVGDDVENCIATSDFPTFRINTQLVRPAFLEVFVKLPYFWQLCAQASEGTTNRARLNEARLLKIKLPLPPLDEQDRFIQANDRLLSSLRKQESGEIDTDALFSSLLTRAFIGELTAEWEAVNAERIAAEVGRLEQRPRLALLALVARSQQYHPEPIGITSLMKYAFLAQMQGNTLSQPANRLYDFVPYHFGPFTQDLYTDLEVLEAEGWVTVERATNGFFDTSERVDISLSSERTDEVESALAKLSDAERADLETVIEKYGDLSHNELLHTVYAQYPVYARKSRLPKSRR